MIQNYWKEFLTNTNRENEEKYTGIICFGMDAQTCTTANEKILSGEMHRRIYPENGYKKAMSGESGIGELNIVTDWKGMPCAVIETTGVYKLQVSELTDEICAGGGLYPSLEIWKEKQMPLIKTEVEELGNAFHDTTLLTVEEFKTVYPIA